MWWLINLIKKSLFKEFILFGLTGLINSTLWLILFYHIILYDNFLGQFLAFQIGLPTDYLLKRYIVFRFNPQNHPVHFEWISLVGLAVTDISIFPLAFLPHYIAYYISLFFGMVTKFALSKKVMWK